MRFNTLSTHIIPLPGGIEIVSFPSKSRRTTYPLLTEEHLLYHAIQYVRSTATDPFSRAGKDERPGYWMYGRDTKLSPILDDSVMIQKLSGIPTICGFYKVRGNLECIRSRDSRLCMSQS